MLGFTFAGNEKRTPFLSSFCGCFKLAAWVVGSTLVFCGVGIWMILALWIAAEWGRGVWFSRLE